MNDAERQLIAGLFDRIRGVESARRDPEAEAFISDQVAQQPHAPYAMAQTLVVQDRSLQAAQARIQELERELEAARSEGERFAPEPSAPAPSPWGPRAQESMARAGSAPGAGGGYGQQSGQMSPPFGAPRSDQNYGQQQPPAGYGQQQPGYGTPRYEQPQASQGGGFLSGALQTAAGVAAGALVFQGVRSLFGGDEAKAHEGGGERAAGDASGAGEAANTGSIGDWYSGLWGGGSDDKQATGNAAHAQNADAGQNDGGDDDTDGFFDLGGDDGGDDGDWT